MPGIEPDTTGLIPRKENLRGLNIGGVWRFIKANGREFAESNRYPACPDDNRSKLLPEILRQAALQPREQGSVICGNCRMSWRQIDLLSDLLAAGLVERGVKPGDRVVVILPNSVQFVIAGFAIWKVRAILVPEDSTIRPANLQHILKEARPAALVVDRIPGGQFEGIKEALRCLKVIFAKDRALAWSGLADIPVEFLEAVFRRETWAPVSPTDARSDEVVSITYTSGSTGTPKGVMHTHESWLASANFTRDYLGISRKDKIVVPLPLHHAYAFRQILAYVLAGGSLVIATDIFSALNLIHEERPTALLLVPAACNILIDHFPSILRQADSVLRYVEIGSGPMAPEQLASLGELLPTTPSHLPYGLTEARVGFLSRGPDGVFNRIESRSPGLEIEVVDGQGQPVAPGQTGEIVLKGRGLMRGYWGDSDAAQEKLKSQGFRTGDLGQVEEIGKIALLGRLDGVLKVGGRKVNPFEVEMTLKRHPAVAESVVVGQPDPRGVLEQELHAFVVLKKVATVKASDLLVHCRQFLEPYKIPARIHFRASLPKSPLGKVQRHMLVAEQAANLSSGKGGVRC